MFFMLEIKESGLNFSFDPRTTKVAVRFDQTEFYRYDFNCFEKSKGVDIIAQKENSLQLIEVKNCSGEERKHVWQTQCNNRQKVAVRDKFPESDISHRDSYDIEVTQKIAMTIAAIVGSGTQGEHKRTKELVPFFKMLTDPKIAENQKELEVIFVLDGNFACESRDNNVVRMELRRSIERKLKWLHCKVIVDSSEKLKDRVLRVRSE